MLDLFTTKTLIVSAYTIRSDGGKAILNAFLSEVSADRSVVCFLPADYFPLIKKAHIRYIFVSCGFISRTVAEFKIHRLSRDPNTELICFNGLPPLIPARSKTFIFCQNRYLVQKSLPQSYNYRFILKLQIQRAWIKVLSRGNEHYIVQTETMKKFLMASNHKITPNLIAQKPFHEKLNFSDLPPEKICRSRFIYIASYDRHKNHERLLKAWEILHTKYSKKPKLILVVADSAVRQLIGQYQLNITIIPHIERSELLKLVGSHTTIYPSLFESYGLPLVEAHQLNSPIIAADRDYVRDVCEPSRVFDPLDPYNIAQTVADYLGSLKEERISNE